MLRRPRSLAAIGSPRFTLIDSRAFGLANATGRQHGRRACERRGRWAFTLIELLVVVAIIAVLAAILLPALGKARSVAKRTVCMNGARQVHIAAMLYGDDLEYFPHGNQFVGYHENLATLGYISRDLFTSEGGCPYAISKYSTSTGDPIRAGIIGSGGTERVAYGLNGTLQHGYGRDANGVFISYGPQKMTMSRVQNYADRVAVITCSPSAYTTDQVSGNWRQLWHVLGYSQNGSWDIPDPEKRRHDGKGLPFTLADGHGEFVETSVITGGKTFWIVGSAPWDSTTGTYTSIMDLSFAYLYRNKNIRD